MAKKERTSAEKWVPLDPNTPITAETVANLRMRPGGSNVEVYWAGPDMKAKLPKGVSPTRGDELEEMAQMNYVIGKRYKKGE